MISDIHNGRPHPSRIFGDDRSRSNSDNDLHVERRRPRKADQSPAGILSEMPALVILERMPIPVLAIAPDGAILFANPAFAAMLGHTQETIRELGFHRIFQNLPSDEPVVDVMRDYADELVELAHHDGYIVRARMSRSAMVRCDDNIALAIFQDLTDRLWLGDL